ncbi:substrate-binding domain-containing protein, partial [Siccibacter turicensis]|uniref:substrate-binding domain-containing protein n=1 Tax=Siccibacter turicensis TaxID=357233 RepID=UPI0039A0DE26
GGVPPPPLSTVQQPMHQLGVRSVQLLLARIDNPDTQPVDEILAWEIVSRGSA